MMRTTLAIYRKELVDTLRDRKTLIFMLLLPTVLMPLLMLGLSRMMQVVQKAEEAKTVRIAASEESRTAYRDLVFEWFRGTELGDRMRVLDTPVLGVLLKSAGGVPAESVPAGITRDPQVFEDWVMSLATQVRANLDSIDEQPAEMMDLLDEKTRGELIDFYRVAIKGMALVEFVDPATLATEGAAAPAHVPESLAGLANLPEIAAAVARRDIQGFLIVPSAVTGLVANDESTEAITFVHDSTIPLSSEAWSRVRTVVHRAGESIVHARLEGRDISRSFLKPIDTSGDADLASPQRRALNVAGSILPYLVIVFAFLGGLYPALDLGAGEKERNTLETLLVSPAGRAEIATGKFLVILTASLTSSVLGMVSMAVSYQMILPEAILELIQLRIEPQRLAPVLLLAVPAAAAFAGLFLALSIYARSFKEAQSYIAPLQFLLILPAVAPLIPGVEMSWKIAAIPLVNISVLARDFLKGDMNWGYYAVSLAVCAALAAACLAYCVRQFRREEVLFRT